MADDKNDFSCYADGVPDEESSSAPVEVEPVDDSPVTEQPEDVEKRKAVEFVEKFLSVIGTSVNKATAITTIQKMFVKDRNTLPFITNVPSSKRVTAVSAHSVFMDDVMKTMCSRLSELGLYTGEVPKAGDFENFVLEEYAQWSTGIDGERARQVLDALGKEYLTQRVEGDRTMSERLFSKGKQQP